MVSRQMAQLSCLPKLRGAPVASVRVVTRREEGFCFGFCSSAAAAAPPDDEGLDFFFFDAFDGPLSLFMVLFAAFFTVSSLSLAALQVSLCPPLQCCFWQALEQ